LLATAPWKSLRKIARTFLNSIAEKQYRDIVKININGIFTPCLGNFSELLDMQSETPDQVASYQALKSSETRLRILSGALSVIRRGGMRSFTIDSVISETGITRGGIQYHFRSKETLEMALLEKLLEDFLCDVQRRAGEGKDGLPWVAALLEYIFDPAVPDKGLWKSLIASLGYRPAIRDHGENLNRIFHRHMRLAGLNEGESLALCMIIEGFTTSLGPTTHESAEALRSFSLSTLNAAHYRSQEKNESTKI